MVVEHTYLGNFPDERQDDWTEECQGVTHDANHWFITQKGAVWRVPIAKNLREHLQDGVDGVRKRPIPLAGYDHFGDPESTAGRSSSRSRASDGSSRSSPSIASRASPPSEPTRSSSSGRRPCPSSRRPAGVRSTPGASCSPPTASSRRALGPRRTALPLPDRRSGALTFVDRIVLRDEHGTPVVLDTMQGGTFADDHHLYISCGFFEHPHPSWGLHLFDMRTQRRIVRSTNGSGSFNYEFHPGDSIDEEPEGLTYWDLDGRERPRDPGTTPRDPARQRRQRRRRLLQALSRRGALSFSRRSRRTGRARSRAASARPSGSSRRAGAASRRGTRGTARARSRR